MVKTNSIDFFLPVSNLFFYQKKQNDFRFNRQKLLSLLQTDSKRQRKNCLKLNLSVTAVYERIEIRASIIDKYVVLLNKAKVEKDLSFLSPKN
jgi:hypothetical protein